MVPLHLNAKHLLYLITPSSAEVTGYDLHHNNFWFCRDIKSRSKNHLLNLVLKQDFNYPDFILLELVSLILFWCNFLWILCFSVSVPSDAGVGWCKPTWPPEKVRWENPKPISCTTQIPVRLSVVVHPVVRDTTVLCNATTQLWLLIEFDIQQYFSYLLNDTIFKCLRPFHVGVNLTSVPHSLSHWITISFIPLSLLLWFSTDSYWMY